MKQFILFTTLALFPILTFAQFKPMEKGLTIYVTDGTNVGTDSRGHDDMRPKGYDTGSRTRKGGDGAKFTDIIRPLGMENSIQAAAFLERPIYGKLGFLLIFCVNDSIGGQQGYIEENGEIYYGVYRLVRPKSSDNEVVPKGMTEYKLSGLVFILGLS